MTTTGLQRAQAVAAAGERLAATHGVVLPEDLRLWALAGGRPSAGRRSTGTAIAEGTSDRPPSDRQPPDRSPPDRPSPDAALPDVADVDLAAALEAATSPRQRRARGLHVTPRWLADHLVGLVVDDTGGGVGPRPGGRAAPPTACDPACGGGAFLVAVARALHARGLPKRQVVEECLWGADIDPVGLAAAEAALAIWSGGAVPPPGRLVVGDPLRAGVGLWGDDRPPDGFDLVVGNPPFQNQLGKATTRARAEQLRLRARFGPAVRAYTDTAWLFLLLGCQFARPGGRVVMVQPDSLAAARDAAVVRAEIDALAHLEELWVDDHNVFAAAVRVCAPVLRRYATPPAGAAAPGAPPGTPPAAAVAAGAGGGAAAAALVPADAGAVTERWHDLLAEATGVPALRMDAAGRLGDRAAALAGFRDEYYGLAAVVREATPGERAAAGPPRVPALVTVGAIDWGRCAWGSRPVRFAKRRWEAPVVDPARLAADGPAAARRWVARTAVPKVLVATQTRVVELAVDEVGAWVPSVPAIAVVPADPDDLWHLAAALASPAATVWLMRRAPGVALARGALKVAARDVADLPLPADRGAWDVAATALRAYASAAAPAPGGPVTPTAREALDAFTCAAARAYASTPEVVAWWRARLEPTLAPVTAR